MIILLQFGVSQFISFREKISANQSILLALAAMLNIRLERKTEMCRGPSKEHSC